LASGTVPPMGAMVKQGLPEDVFAFYLGHEAAGDLVIGGVDESHYTGDFQTIPLTANTYWQVELTGISVAGKSFKSAVSQAIIDSGTSLLAGPTKDVNRIMSAIGAMSNAGLYQVSCSKLQGVTFSLGGIPFPLTGDDLVIQRQMGQCLLGVQGSDGLGPMWILGDVFMRPYYVKFDWCNSEVGIAKAKKSNDDATVVV